MVNSLRGFGELLLHGFVANNAPNMFKGMLNTYLTDYNINSKMISELVMKNQSLWSLLPEDQYGRVQNVLAQIGSIDWLTSDWLINAVREKHTAIASLFLSWKKGRNWLDRQVAEIKEGVSKFA